MFWAAVSSRTAKAAGGSPASSSADVVQVAPTLAVGSPCNAKACGVSPAPALGPSCTPSGIEVPSCAARAGRGSPSFRLDSSRVAAIISAAPRSVMWAPAAHASGETCPFGLVGRACFCGADAFLPATMAAIAPAAMAARTTIAARGSVSPSGLAACSGAHCATKSCALGRRCCGAGGCGVAGGVSVSGALPFGALSSLL